MINIGELTQEDIGKPVAYSIREGVIEYGTLTGWNGRLVFVKFKGPNGEACRPEDITFWVGYGIILSGQ